MASPQDEFVRRAAPGAKRGFREFGVPASVTIAQAALESAWGRSHIGSANNYFGIKAQRGGNGRVTFGDIAIGHVAVPTREHIGGRDVTVTGLFRKYRSMADSMRDHGRFLRDNPRYKPAFAFKHDANEFARAIHRAGYATDPQYSAKLISIMRANDLYRFDHGVHPVKAKNGTGAAVKPHPHPTHATAVATKPKATATPKAKPKRQAEVRAEAYLAGLQRDLNTHLLRLGSAEQLAVDGVWDPHTARAFQYVCRILGIEPERSVRTFRLIAGAADARTPQEIKRAAQEGAQFTERLKRRFEHTRGVGAATVGGKALPAAERATAFIVAVQRDLNSHLRRLGSPRVLSIDGKWNPYTERAFVQVCKVLGIAPKRDVRTFRLIAGAAAAARTADELARATAEGAEFESRLRSEFAAARAGAGRVVVGGRSLPEKERAQAFVAGLQRDLNTQLKWLGSTTLVRIDGTWDPQTERAFRRVCTMVGVEPKRDVRTFRVIAGATAARSDEEMLRAAGDGAAFEQQLKAFFAVEPSVLVTQHGKPPPGSHGNGGAAAKSARTFRVRKPEMKGKDIAGFQRMLNQRYKRWGIDTRIDDDGEFGTLTRRAAREIAFGLGIGSEAYSHGITPALREKIRDPRQRTPAEVARAQRRRDWLRRARRRHKGGGPELALSFARSHIGLQESGTNRGKLIDSFNRTAGSPLGSAWCGNFMNACLMAAGFPSQPFLAGCRNIESHARAGTGGWLWTSKPRPGDLVLYTIGGAANHVGMVEKVGSGVVVTIEGNTRKDGEGTGAPADGVERRNRPISLPRGYARPPYAR